MTRGENDILRSHAERAAPEREDVQQVMTRWGTLPVPVAPRDVLDQRRERGAVTLRAVIGSARRERQVHAMRTAVGAVAAASLLVWGGLRVFGSGPHSATTVGALSGLFGDRDFGDQDATVQDPSEVWGGQRGWLSAEAGRELAPGDRVRAVLRPVSLKLAQVTSARVAPGSVLAIVTLEPGLQELRVESGVTAFDVDPRRQAEVVVHAPGARIRVKGTAFSVSSGGANTTAWSEVIVTRGRVEVDSAGKSFVLEAGDSWSSRPTASDAARELDTTDVDPGRTSGAEVSARRPAPVASRDSSRPSTRPGDDQRAAEKTGSADSGEATTLSEENRLFRSALSARNNGGGARCVALLSEFLGKFPGSPLRQEAMVAHFRCLRSSGDMTSARRSAARYLSEYPGGFAQDEARGLVLDLAH